MRNRPPQTTTHRRGTGASAGLTVGIDVGGTSIRAAVVNADGQVLDSIRAPTPDSARALDEALDRAVGELAARHPVDAVGLAVAGFVDRDRATVQFAPHLPWVNTPVATAMSSRLGLPVVLEHDANAALWAEYKFGTMAGEPTGHSRNVVLIAIGTGIGSALLIDGALYRGSHGVAPELGHLTVVPGGRACSCGKRGCWERYCSGSALAATAVELGSTLVGEVTGRRVAADAQDGDAIAVAAVADFGRWLGLGLATVADIFDPDLIVIAGGVSSSAALYLDEAREGYADAVTGAGYRRLARIRVAQLGESAGLIGAAELARTTVLAT